MILGIIGNTLYLSPLYGGDHEHRIEISNDEKKDLLESGADEFHDIDYIECQLHGMTITEYHAQMKVWDANDEATSIKGDTEDNGLPF